MSETLKADSARREGTYRSRVFVGGSYYQEMRNRLDDIKSAVIEAGFHAVVADEVQLENSGDIHHETMALLHSCRLAVFELSRPSGALMEIERVPDYGIQALILFNAPKDSEYIGSRMLTTFVKEHESSIQISSYLRSDTAQQIISSWLEQQRKAGFG